MGAGKLGVVDDGWCLDATPGDDGDERSASDGNAESPRPRAAEPPDLVVEAERIRLSELLREAMLILDGEAPDVVPLSGDGWSLLGPPSHATPEPEPEPEPEPQPQAEATPTPTPEPEPEASEADLLRSAVHDALDEARAEGWTFADDEAPREDLVLSTEEQAFFDAGDALAKLPAAPVTVAADFGIERRAGFWERFWRKTA